LYNHNLSKERKEWQKLIHNLPEGIIIKISNSFKLVNESALKMLGIIPLPNPNQNRIDLQEEFEVNLKINRIMIE
jgi:hypothetical protein